MSIHFDCSCGRPMHVPDHMAGKTMGCPGCGAYMMVPGTPVAAPDKPCRSCRTPVPAGAPFCSHCGWSTESAERRCAACGGRLVPEAGAGMSGVIVNVSSTGLGALGMVLGGWLGAITVGCGFGALGNLYRHLTLRYRCRQCGEAPPASRFTEDEVRPVRFSRNVAFFVMMLWLTVLALGAFLWLALGVDF